ncbi:MAG: type II toxin-antitoxin system HicB family antitoxin [Hydrogenophaga sp.]|jgi:predicted transcriptional regulator|uniref:YlcI/YnfO family protein n=1 Tax=Hydrogenophaga sp. TaxID=1904254 RepID=UPI0026139C5C|nr:YlcI/YnfO family protein [Hydrogenophaga sp.]MCV0440092.1 type II toxin-antitoxin system HicB family antitoxin [Hydrogenophaga sp.]
MTALTIRLPNSLHARIRELAARDDMSVNQFIASAAGEKLASLLTVDYLREEAAKGHRVDFDRFMKAVPDVADEADKA